MQVWASAGRGGAGGALVVSTPRTHSEAVTQQWQRLAIEVQARRRELRFYTQDDLAEAAGVSRRTIGTLERGGKVSSPTLRAVEIALRWTPGSADDVLRGGRPTPIEQSTATPPPPDLRDDVERQIWAITELVEEERWFYIDLHRTRQQRERYRDSTERNRLPRLG